MTTALQILKARMQDPEFNRRFTEAAYNRIEAKYPTVEDLPFKLPEDFRDM